MIHLFSKHSKKKISRLFTGLVCFAALLASSCGSSGNGGGGGGAAGGGGSIGDGTGITLNYDLNSTPSWMGRPVSCSYSPTSGKVSKIRITMAFNLYLFANELTSLTQTYNSFVADSDVVISGSAMVEAGTGLAKMGAYREVQGTLHTSFSVRLKAGSKMPFLTRSNEQFYSWGVKYTTEINLLETVNLDKTNFATQLTIKSGTISGRLRWSTESLPITSLQKSAVWVNDNAAPSSSSSSKAPKPLTDGSALRDYAKTNGKEESAGYYCFSENYKVDNADFFFGLNYLADDDILQLVSCWDGFFPDGYVMMTYFVWRRTDVSRNNIAIVLADPNSFGFSQTAFYIKDYQLLDFPNANSNSGVLDEVVRNDLGVTEFSHYIHDAIEITKESFRHTEKLLERIDGGTRLW